MLNTQSAEARIFSVSELAQVLNLALEAAVPSAAFKGEVSQVTRASSGHLYFTVKDERSQLACVMWSSLTKSLGFVPTQGMDVVCFGKPNLYGGNGKLQIVVSKMLPGGLGALQLKFQELKRKLQAEGLFAPERKRPLPFLPRALGVITSKSGAVIHDIMVRVRERMPSLQVYLVDVRVQGQGASEEIAAALDFLDQQKLVDVIIVGRGGGSLEDLWAFNEESVVRAIFRCSVPVISAVGHETDFSLSDYVADCRAPTPTAAAEMAVPRRDELISRISELERRLFDVERWMGPCSQAVDEQELRLQQQMKHLLQTMKLRIDVLERGLRAANPVVHLSSWKSRVDNLSARLDYAMGTRFKASIDRLTGATGRLHALNPGQVLERGYALVELDGGYLRDTSGVAIGTQVSVRLARGRFGARVLEIDP